MKWVDQGGSALTNHPNSSTSRLVAFVFLKALRKFKETWFYKGLIKVVMLLKINQNGQEFRVSTPLLICAGCVFELGGGYRR